MPNTTKPQNLSFTQGKPAPMPMDANIARLRLLQTMALTMAVFAAISAAIVAASLVWRIFV